MRAPTTLGLAALLLLALGGLYLSHVSLAADPAHAPQGDLLARLRATEQRAAAAEKLAADAIAHAREMRLGNVDQLVCSAAERFVGNKWSSFTHHVCYLRQQRGDDCVGADIYDREIDPGMAYV